MTDIMVWRQCVGDGVGYLWMATVTVKCMQEITFVSLFSHFDSFSFALILLSFVCADSLKQVNVIWPVESVISGLTCTDSNCTSIVLKRKAAAARLHLRRMATPVRVSSVWNVLSKVQLPVNKNVSEQSTYHVSSWWGKAAATYFFMYLRESLDSNALTSHALSSDASWMHKDLKVFLFTPH